MASNRPSVPAHMKLATAVDLPIDIVRDILEHAARVNLSNDPSYAASLQLICASARDWLMPVLFLSSL
ncbi:hypothetical protein BKA62DRAFT_412348 [Auriculariales sp. MPI-PUGE-AT-0066]|nr:hypothetical protein BKA62DRAFT_412348 [Auriculariales sp. MPI-PUGE-AT-0066]